MTHEEVIFFNLSRAYAEPKHDYLLEGLDFDAKAKMYRLTFREPSAPRHITREVCVFEDKFREAVAQGKLGEDIRSNIDHALGNQTPVHSREN